MKGTRPLDNQEIRQVSGSFDGTYEGRNRALFMLGVSTGGRISELLGLQIGDVYQNRAPVTDLLFDKSIVKGKEHSRAVPVNRDGRQAIDDLIKWHRKSASLVPITELTRQKTHVAPCGTTHNKPATKNSRRKSVRSLSNTKKVNKR